MFDEYATQTFTNKNIWMTCIYVKALEDKNKHFPSWILGGTENPFRKYLSLRFLEKNNKKWLAVMLWKACDCRRDMVLAD